nr:AI-2E family transporter [Tessaracoccus coleopterorum]
MKYVSGAILPVLLALLVTSVLWPLTARLRSWGVPYALGAIISMLLGIGIIGGLIGLIAPSVAHQWDDLRTQSLDGIRRIQTWLAGPPLNINDDEINRYITQAVSWLQDRSGDIVTSLVNIGGSVGSGVVTLLTMLIITFFMLKDGSKFVGWVRGLVGRRAGFHATELLTRLWSTLSGYIRTQAVVSFVDAFFIGLGAFVLGVPLAFPIAVLTFMAGFIPIVGAVTAGTIAVLVALVSNGLTTALLVLAVVLGVQQLEGHILQPLLQSRVMQLHPVIVLLAVLLGSSWAGIVGAFLAVPVAASAAVLVRYLGDLTDLRTGRSARATSSGSPMTGRRWRPSPSGPRPSSRPSSGDAPSRRSRRSRRPPRRRQEPGGGCSAGVPGRIRMTTGPSRPNRVVRPSAPSPARSLRRGAPCAGRPAPADGSSSGRCSRAPAS